MINFHLL